MTTIIKFKLPVLLLLIVVAGLFSCKDDWDNHYDKTLDSKSSLNLHEYIKSRSDLSTFQQVLHITGFDSILSKNLTYTVWAPDNETLADLSLKDTVELRKFVRSYITRFSSPTQGLYLKPAKLLMLNDKLMMFEKSGDGYTFDGNKLIEKDIALANGILHVLSDYKPYVRNIYEYINETKGLDSLRIYLASLNKKNLDMDKSFSNGVFVDSIFKTTNYMLDTLAHFSREDSIYTAILPDNVAWKDAYSRAYPYFKTTAFAGGTKAQDVLTRKAIVNDMFFRTRLTLPIQADTLRSTGANTISSPNRLFDGAQKVVLSNGDAYVTSQFKNTAYDSWYKTINIEAEWEDLGRTQSNYSLSPMSSIGTGFSLISRRYYLAATPTSSSSLSTFFLRFPLPNNLSAKYNIYCVFVPSIITNPKDTLPYSVQFKLSYMASTGKQVLDAAIDKNNKVLTPTGTSATFTTDGKTLQKMLVAKEFEFPYSNLYNGNNASITTALKVQYKSVTGVPTSKELKIDCIILEPVQ